jgi:hypothetical protein
MCSGGWFAHDADAELPGQHDGQQPCDEHACFCNGAPVSPEKPVDLQASELSFAAAFMPALGDDSATDLLADAEAISVGLAPPASDRVLPLLI